MSIYDLGKTINYFTTIMNISRRSPFVTLPDEVNHQLFPILTNEMPYNK